MAAAVALTRLVRAASVRPPLDATHGADAPSISVVVPARDEAERIEPLLVALDRTTGVDEIIVVDDQSSDATAEVAAAHGVRVVMGSPPPDGWAGKTWALQQGIEAATSEWVVTLDADTRPAPELVGSIVDRARSDRTDLLTIAGRFEGGTPGARWLHPAMLTTLVYRFGPPGATARPAAHRVLANGQCVAFRRDRLLAAGGFKLVAGSHVEDVALARHLASLGWSVDFLDGASLLTVQAERTLRDVWAGWGRSLGLGGVEPARRQALDALVVLLTVVVPLGRLCMRRVDLLDGGLLVTRLGVLVGTRTAYTKRGTVYWLSPAADAIAWLAMVTGIVRPAAPWRGRRPPAA